MFVFVKVCSTCVYINVSSLRVLLHITEEEEGGGGKKNNFAKKYLEQSIPGRKLAPPAPHSLSHSPKFLTISRQVPFGRYVTLFFG